MHRQCQLPLELVDWILFFLRDDHLSLQCCAEVNQAFLKMAERHLYHSIKFYNFEPEKTAGEWDSDELAQLFIRTPRLGFHVRVLQIEIASRGTPWVSRQIAKEEHIGQILPLFPRISTIILSGRMSWKKFHQVFLSSFAQMLDQISVEDISIDGIDNFPFSLLNQCQSLKRLSLINIDGPLSMPKDSPTESASNNKRAQLTFLRVEDSQLALPTILSWLSSPYSPQIRHLSSLHISISGTEHIHRLQVLLEDCSRQLKELYLHANQYARTTYNMANKIVYPTSGISNEVLKLSQSRFLKSLSISGIIGAFDGYDYWDTPSTNGEEHSNYDLNTCIPWFIQTLQTIDTPNNIEQIVFDILFQVDETPFANLQDWEPLASILRSDVFSSLRRVELRVQCIGVPFLEFPSLMPMLHNDVHLSSLVQSGLLSISTVQH